MNWAIAQALAMVQALLVKQKLKFFDGIDVDRVREKDQEIRDKIQQNMSQQLLSQKPQIQFDYNNFSGDIKIRDGREQQEMGQEEKSR